MDKSRPVAVSEVRHVNDIELTGLEKSCEPQIFRGACANWPAAGLWTGNWGHDRLNRLCGSAQIQVMRSQDGNYRGDLRNRETEICTLSEFLDHTASPPDELSEHWYIAQMPMHSLSSSDEASLGALMVDISIPDSLQRSRRLSSVNFWMASSRGSKSSLHYDQQHNLLCVVAGEKEVQLYPPEASSLLAPLPLWGESANHSGINFAQPEAQHLAQLEAAHRQKLNAILKAGDVLFVPEGFWHQVSSQPGTIAVNFWWESAISCSLLGTASEPYYLRRLLQAAVIEKKAELLMGVAMHPLLVAAEMPNGCTGSPQAPEGCLKRIQRCQQLHLESHEDAIWTLALRTLSAPELVAAVLLAVDLYEEPNAEPGHAEIFQTLPAASVRKLLSFLSQNYPRAVAKMLKMLTPVATMLLIKRFEEADADPEQQGGQQEQQEFYAQLYHAVEDRDALQHIMVEKQEIFARQAALATLSEQFSL